MFLFYLLAVLISYSQECAPTSPVGTTTISPNVTSTTTTLSPNVTTSPVESTTTAARNECCPWPFGDTGVNSVMPIQSQWNNCNQSLIYVCSNTNVTDQARIALAVNYTTETANNLPPLQITNPTPNEQLFTTLVCDPTTNLWGINGTAGAQYSLFGCAYLLPDGVTWILERTGA